MIKSCEAPAGRTSSGRCGDAFGGGSTSSPASGSESALQARRRRAWLPQQASRTPTSCSVVTGPRALVFVHGFLDDQHVWDPVLADLSAPGFETVQFDQAGFGRRAAATGPVTFDRFAADLNAIVDAIGKPFVLVGHSMAGPVAAAAANTRPDSVRAAADMWNNGHPAGDRPSGFTGPVLVLSGTDDPLITAEVVASAIAPGSTRPS